MHVTVAARLFGLTLAVDPNRTAIQSWILEHVEHDINHGLFVSLDDATVER